MPELRNPRWEAFCKHYVDLGNASEAYRRAGYHSDPCNNNSARLSAIESIKKRVTELRAQQVFKTSMEREELAGYYVATIRTPAGEVHANHPLCQSVEVSEKGMKIRMPDKNAAAAGLARLSGWDAAAKLEVSVENPLTSYLRELRAKVIDGTVRELGDSAQPGDDDGLAPSPGL